MQPAVRHDWNLAPAAARELQQALAPRVRCEDQFGTLERIAGVDVGFENGGRITRAAVVVMQAETFEVREQILHREPTRFPYVPGLLSFREIPAVLAAMAKLKATPDLILCDGQGIAHPRRLGVAAHLGLLIDLPAIGVGKSRLVGSYEEPGPGKGSWSVLQDKQEAIGRVVRTRTGVKPVFVSPGHRVSMKTAMELVLRFTTRYRLPEPIRAADRLSSSRSLRNKSNGQD